MPYNPANLAEIDNKLREDFRRRLIEAGYQQADVNDPVLRILFRSFAGQLEALYAAPEHVRGAFLDELIAGLGLEPRMARPAQTVVRFYAESGGCVIGAGNQLTGETPTGERLVFTTDETISVSPARISFAASYQAGALQLSGGMQLADDLLSAQPSYDPLPVSLGACDCIYVAVENLPDGHLSGHSFFFDVPESEPEVRRALGQATWCFAQRDGRFGAPGILRPRRANAGVRALEWLLAGWGETGSSSSGERPALFDGFYAGRVFVLPGIPPERQFVCAVPRSLATPLGRIFRGAAGRLNSPRAWIRIVMPQGLPNLHTAIQSIALHAISASNVVEFNQTIDFEKQGTSIPVSREGGADRYLVVPLSVAGEDNTPYIPEFQSSPNTGAGRFSVRNGRMDITRARRGDAPDRTATLRTWVTSGELANTVPAGKVQTLLKPDDAPSIRMNNPMPAAGGTNGEPLGSARERCPQCLQTTPAAGTGAEPHASARERFARALLSRDRIVTETDLDLAVRSFDARIVGVTVTSGLQPTSQGLIRVQRVLLDVDAGRFQDAEELRILQEEAGSWLRERMLYDMEIAVECQWAADSAASIATTG